MKKMRNNIKQPPVEVTGSHVESLPSGPENGSLWREPFIHILLILMTGFIIYANSLSVPFIYDDFDCILKNPAVKSFSCFPDTQSVKAFNIYKDIQNNVILRPVAYFTFAINYALHNFDLFGYHLVNMLLHIANAMLVYCLFSQLLVSVQSGDHERDGADNLYYLPLFAALLFVCHPLQTQAVTYIIQRFVPLVTFFYLAALTLYVQFRCTSRTRSRILIYALSLTAAVLAMESKEIAFTLPVIMVLLEFMFLSGAIGSRIAGLIPFLLTMAIIPTKLLSLAAPSHTENTKELSASINLVNFKGISSWDYLMTQFGVIVTYIRLLFLPVRQNLDYDYPLQTKFFSLEVLLPLVLLLIIAGSGIYMLKISREERLYKVIAFGIFWFFITLSVESSIVPIDDLIFEHRAYLPSIGIFISLLTASAVIFMRVTGRLIGTSKRVTLLLVVLVAGLSAASVLRIRVWQDEVTFWRDVVKKSPNKATAHLLLGEAIIRQNIVDSGDDSVLSAKILLQEGGEKCMDEAIKSFNEVIRLRPEFFVGYLDLAIAQRLRKDFNGAFKSLSTVIRLKPEISTPHVIRGKIYEEKGDLVAARNEFLTAIRLEPNNHNARRKLANMYVKEDNIQGAIEELELIMRIYPDEDIRKALDDLKKGK